VKKITIYSKWDVDKLECVCLLSNPLCDRYKQCEELDLVLNVYGDIEECMRNRKYKKEHGVVKQIGK
jgi:uncharacterized membrane protein